MSREDIQREARSAAKAVYLGDGALLAVVLGKYKMVLDARDRGIVPHLALDGFWESWVTAWVQRNVRAGECALNIGANCGYYATLLCDLVGPTGHVVAVEPMPQHVVNMRHTGHLNGFRWLTVVDGVCSNSDGQATVAYAEHMTMNAQVAGGRLKTVCDKTVDVTRYRSDTLMQKLEKRCTFALIDAECHEPMVWDGMSGLLSEQRLRVVLEFSPAWYDDPGAFVDRMVADGFRMAVITLDGGERFVTRQELLAGGEQMVVARR